MNVQSAINLWMNLLQWISKKKKKSKWLKIHFLYVSCLPIVICFNGNFFCNFFLPFTFCIQAKRNSEQKYHLLFREIRSWSVTNTLDFNKMLFHLTYEISVCHIHDNEMVLLVVSWIVCVRFVVFFLWTTMNLHAHHFNTLCQSDVSKQ